MNKNIQRVRRFLLTAVVVVGAAFGLAHTAEATPLSLVPTVCYWSDASQAWAYADGALCSMTDHGLTVTVQWGSCEEDEPCWDCRAMGNRICGPTDFSIYPREVRP